ncbi:hypothetical protein D1818_13605 [Aquimarina sp. BL5]|uniref:hypothetical protein n=1 Tax=Aquimarina sp. BL5 TaxID=1714860 RepID=UPI000E53CDD7|nr:hypothetical protein [Aquimarina sp. BL5]AXT51829.1 hypothetical protein D1818_13605 [Aquimarina sp. BL5]RKN11850.1 hypothetical protein D7036_00360 [Aquimarina sp. BL5]
MRSIKIKISRFLIISGFLLSMGNYGMQLLDFYQGDIASVVYSIDDTEEKSESNEKDSSEKEDLKEKDKISQDSYIRGTRMSFLVLKDYPEFYFNNNSVYLEYKTPPPEYS